MILIFASIDDINIYHWGNKDDIYYFLGRQIYTACVLGWISFACSITHFIFSFNEKNKASQNLSILILLFSFAIAVSASVLC